MMLAVRFPATTTLESTVIPVMALEKLTVFAVSIVDPPPPPP